MNVKKPKIRRKEGIASYAIQPDNCKQHLLHRGRMKKNPATNCHCSSHHVKSINVIKDHTIDVSIYEIAIFLFGMSTFRATKETLSINQILHI
jgi:hypothetical protein